MGSSDVNSIRFNFIYTVSVIVEIVSRSSTETQPPPGRNLEQDLADGRSGEGQI